MENYMMDRVDMFGRKACVDVLKDKEKYGNGFANFFQKRQLLDDVAGQATAVAREIEKCAIDGRFEEVDYALTRFFDSVEKSKQHFRYIEARR